MKYVFGLFQTTGLLFALAIAPSSALGNEDGDGVFADPFGGEELRLCQKVQGKKEPVCHSATAAEAVGWSRSCGMINTPAGMQKSCKWIRLKNNPNAVDATFEACKEVNFITWDKDVVSKWSADEKKYYENMAVACGARVQILPQEVSFWSSRLTEMRTKLHERSRTEEAKSLLEMGIRGGKLTLEHLDIANQEMRRTACCFMANSKGHIQAAIDAEANLDTTEIKANSALSEVDIQIKLAEAAGAISTELEGKMNSSCSGADTGNLVGSRARAEGKTTAQFCQERMKNGRDTYNRLLPQLRSSLIRAGRSTQEQEFDYLTRDQGKPKPGFHMNMTFAEAPGTMTPSEDCFTVPLVDLGIGSCTPKDRTYSPITKEERDLAIADEKQWMEEIEAEWKADKEKHDAMLMPRLEAIRAKLFPSLPESEGIEKARAVYGDRTRLERDFFENKAKPHVAFKGYYPSQATEFEPKARPAVASHAAAESNYEKYMRERFIKRREKQADAFKEIINQAPLFAFLAKDNPSDAEIGSAILRAAEKFNQPMQDRFQEALVAARNELAAAKREGRTPDPMVAQDFMEARGIFEEELKGNPELCAAATALAKYVDKVQGDRDIMYGIGTGVVILGATLATGYGGAVVAGSSGASSTGIVTVSTGIGVVGGVGTGLAFLAVDENRVVRAREALFSVDGIATNGTGVRVPGNVDRVREAELARIISAATVAFPGDVKFFYAASLLGGAGLAARIGKGVGRNFGGLSRAEWDDLLKRMQAGDLGRLSVKERRAIAKVAKQSFWGGRTPTDAEVIEMNQIFAVLMKSESPNRVLPKPGSKEFAEAYNKIGEFVRSLKDKPGMASIDDIVNVLREVQGPNGFQIGALELEDTLGAISGMLRFGMEPKDIVARLKNFDDWITETGQTGATLGLTKVYNDALASLEKEYPNIYGPNIPPHKRLELEAQLTDGVREEHFRRALRENNVRDPEAQDRLVACGFSGRAA